MGGMGQSCARLALWAMRYKPVQRVTLAVSVTIVRDLGVPRAICDCCNFRLVFVER